MSLRMNQNVLSMRTHRHLFRMDRQSETHVTRLASGLRVNHAWDDPAAISVSERMRAQISSMTEAERNISHAINLLNTAESSLGSIDDKLIRMRALALEASNGTLSSSDRSYLDREFQQLKSEITRVASITEYNGLHLLDGTYSSGASGANGQGIKIHLGVHNVANEDYYYVNFNDMRAAALGLDTASIADTANSQAALARIDLALDNKNSEQTRIGSYVTRLQHSLNSLMQFRESTTESESTLRDADIARSMSDLTRSQILMQSSISMTTQANQLPNIVAGLF